MQFFTSPGDLGKWIQIQGSADAAAEKILGIIGKQNEQDIVDTCRAVYEGKDENASKVLFNVLAKYKLTQIREGKMQDKIIKEAQAVMRTDSLYGNMDMRICPKLPKQSAGQGLISTYNCRHYCLDSLVLDEDPNRVYCAEALWRRHVMDKFAREWKDKDGHWQGGYINERFQVCHDDGGNNMELAHGERTRKPRPHQYSTERRLNEARGDDTSKIDLTASSGKIIKLAEKDRVNMVTDDEIYQMFSDVVEMKEAGISDEDILMKVADHYEKPIPEVAVVHKLAMNQLKRYNGVVYSYDNSKIIQTSAVKNPAVKKTTDENITSDIVTEEMRQDMEEIGLTEDLPAKDDFPVVEL